MLRNFGTVSQIFPKIAPKVAQNCKEKSHESSLLKKKKIREIIAQNVEGGGFRPPTPGPFRVKNRFRPGRLSGSTNILVFFLGNTMRGSRTVTDITQFDASSVADWICCRSFHADDWFSWIWRFSDVWVKWERISCTFKALNLLLPGSLVIIIQISMFLKLPGEQGNEIRHLSPVVFRLVTNLPIMLFSHTHSQFNLILFVNMSVDL